MCTSELPTCLVKQVTKLGDRAFCAVEETHHLRCAKNQLGHPCRLSSLFLTFKSIPYTAVVARPKLGSSGSGGGVSSAPGISCVAGSSQAYVTSRSTQTSWVLGPAAARIFFSILRQYSSDQSWSTLLRRKTVTSSSCAGCGSKKLWPLGSNVRVALGEWRRIYTNLGASPGRIRSRLAG